MLFNIPYIANWKKIGAIGNTKQILTTNVKIKKRVDFDYKVGDKRLIVKDGILCKAESPKQKELWTITTIHMNETIRVTCETKSERLNVRRVESFF